MILMILLLSFLRDALHKKMELIRWENIAGWSHFTSLKSHLVSITTSSNLIDPRHRGEVGLQ